MIDSDQANARAASRRQVLGNHRPSDIQRRTAQLRAGVRDAEQLLLQVDTMPPPDAARALRAKQEPAAPVEAARTAKTSATVTKSMHTHPVPGGTELWKPSEQVHGQSPSL